MADILDSLLIPNVVRALMLEDPPMVITIYICISNILGHIINYIYMHEKSNEFACRLPFWPYTKLIFCLWLVLPIFNGAAYIYENLVRTYVKVGNYVSSNIPEGQRRVLQMMSLDARKSVERYIEKYGPEAFDRVVKAVRTLFPLEWYLSRSN